MVDIEPYLEVLVALNRQRNEALDILGKKIREEVVIPACQKMGLYYYCNSYYWYFYTGSKTDRRTYHITKMDKDAYQIMQPVVNLLYTVVDADKDLGMFVPAMEE